jgi:hypothetical protein
MNVFDPAAAGTPDSRRAGCLAGPRADGFAVGGAHLHRNYDCNSFSRREIKT